MCTLHRLEAPLSRTQAGILFTWDDGTSKQAAFAVSRDMDVQGTAKRIAAEVLDNLMKRGRADLASETNWVSVVAGVSKHIRDCVALLPVEPRSTAEGAIH